MTLLDVARDLLRQADAWAEQGHTAIAAHFTEKALREFRALAHGPERAARPGLRVVGAPKGEG